MQPPPTPSEARILRRANRWLADRGADAPVCGSRERSLEVFGDEKLLDERLRHGRLFSTRLFSYELLRARRTAPGLVTEIVGQAPTALVIENADTFRALGDVIAEDEHPAIGLIAWGAGAAFEQSCGALSTLSVAGQPLDRAWYFGDIDPSGLRIPANAAQLVRPLRLEPARGLYRMLLDRDQRVPAREQLTDATEEHLGWLGEPDASYSRNVMRNRGRLPQEALRAEVIRAYSWGLV